MGSVLQGCVLVVGLAQALAACGQTERDAPGTAPVTAPAASGSPTTNPTTGGATGASEAEAGSGVTGGSGSIAGGGSFGAGSGPLGTGGQPPSAPPQLSPGCSVLSSQATGQYVQLSVHVTGATLDPNYTVPAHERGYAVWLPPDYTPTHTYRTVFLAPSCGGTDTGETRLMGGDYGYKQAIYVGLAPPPQEISANGCSDNSGMKSVEWEYFALVAEAVEAAYCVDKNDELVEGSQSGGTLANMLGCYFGGVDQERKFGPNLTLRAQLSFASRLPVDLPKCGGPIAALWMHDPNETNPPPSDSLTSRDRVLALDGCTDNPTEPWGTGPLAALGCTKFVSCPASYPVVFCQALNRGRQSNYYDLVAPAYVQLAAELGAAP